MTPHTFLLFPLGLALLLFSRQWLYRLLIASLLFSGTAVLNIGSGADASGVQIWMFFGSLWLIRDIATRLVHGDLSLPRGLLVPVSWLALFLFVVTLSLVMPVYIHGGLRIASPYLTDASTTPLFFSSRNLTSWLYVVFGGLLAVSVAQQNRTLEDLAETGRTYLWSGVFVALWGFFQLFCALIEVPYPALLFNNSASPGALGYSSHIPEIAFKRMASVTLEPSILSQVLLTVIPLTIPAVLGCGYLVSRSIDRACFALLCLALVATTSSSAYLGLLMLLLGILILAVKMRITNRRTTLKVATAAAVGLPSCLALLYAGVPLFRTIMDFSLFSKASSYSALERVKTIHDAFGYFLAYPILGIGWGSVASHDLVFKLLASIGVLGFLSFAVMIFWIALRLYLEIRGKSNSIALTQMVWLLSLTMLMFMNLIGGFGYVLGHLWVILGMTMACVALSSTSVQSGGLD